MKNKKFSVAHLTSAHLRYDSRIFLKECQSLASNGFNVFLVVADGGVDEVKDGVHILGVKKASSRLDRMRTATRRVYEKALTLDADVYHLHDPELMPIGLKLKRKGKKVIFDAHEDLPLQLLNKHYSKKWLLKLLSKAASFYEGYACSRFAGVVAATPTIEKKFKKINANTESVNNYPLLNEVSSSEVTRNKSGCFCYVGGIAEARGIYEMLEALDYCPSGVTISLAGSFNSEVVENRARNMPQWDRVDFFGFLDRAGVAGVYKKSVAGLVTLHPIPNYLDALPVKMFEYMGAGLPVIASNIPLWKKIIDDAQCGICVDPYKPNEIAEAMVYFWENPEEAKKMGENGQKAVREKYNWAHEEKKLVKFYKDVVTG